MKKTKCVAILLVAIVSALFISANAADYYDSYGERCYFDRYNPYYLSDYALVVCDDFGGSFENTDFHATTTGTGTDVYNLTKVATVHVWFYDNDGEQTEGNNRNDILYWEDMRSADVFGSEYVNNEYGLNVFTSQHTEYFYDDRYVDSVTRNPIVFGEKIIYFDTTGYYR